ncbi:GNAT family N-acetyltransferase [Roseateles sp.]|uniref:GNAT family N-acetyltransferase n=1 Tax=Roseateles sp. TaxID=1971397 RepID=UPI0025EB8427|nr:GNAT family N-acetyltransferase [Roseateles sp.]
MTTPTLAPVADADFEAMLALRIEALRESLERLGRFDPGVARARLRSQFRPEWMQHLVVDGERVGYFTVEPREGELRLHHLYLKPSAQGRGLGAWVMGRLKAQGLPIALAALRGSRANDFYHRHGFRVVEEQDFDIEYRWEAGA